MCVGENGLLFKVPSESMAGPRRDEIREKKAIEKDTLRTEDENSHGEAWLGQLQKRKQVHAFVVGFLYKSFNPNAAINFLSSMLC
jgi:hypothetical protein